LEDNEKECIDSLCFGEEFFLIVEIIEMKNSDEPPPEQALNGSSSSHHSNANGDDTILIEIDVDLLSQPKAKRVKALHLNERFMKTQMIPKRTHRELRKIFSDIQQLNDTMETMHVQLETTPVTGALLALAVTPRLTALHVKSGLLLANADDRQALGKVIYEHELLAEITLHNLTVKEGLLMRWNKNAPPPLDILVPAFTSIVFLNVLELSCCPEMELPPPDAPPNATFTPKPMLSMLGVKELCQSLTLQRLELSRLGLTDDHFGVLVEQISQNSATSCLTELIVNENRNTDTGLDMLSSLLFKSNCALERLECYQSDSVVLGTTVELLQQAMQNNTRLTTLRIHLWGEESDDNDHDGDDMIPNLGPKKSRIHFFTKLNRLGRKRLIDKTTTTAQWLDLMASAKNDPSQLYFCLRNSGYWWKCRGIAKSRPGDFIMPTTNRTVPSPPPSPELSSSEPSAGKETKRGSQSRLAQLKNRHSQLLVGLNLNNEVQDDLLGIVKDEDTAVLSDVAAKDLHRRTSERHLMLGKESEHSIEELLEARNLPQFLNLDHDSNKKEDGFHDSRMSMISLGAESYIEDLMHQKDKRPAEAREEVLEEALEELDYATTHNKLPPGMSEDLFFHNVLKRLIREKEKEEKERERKLDALLENALLKEVAKGKAAKEQETVMGEAQQSDGKASARKVHGKKPAAKTKKAEG